MALCLSDRDLEELGQSVEVLLSPMDYADADGWRSAVNRALRPLLRADAASFILPGSGSVPVYSEELDIDEVNRYSSALQPLDQRLAVWRRQVEMGVWSREALHRPYRDQYYRSTYYNEYIVPLRCHDAIGLTIGLGPHLDAASVAGVLFHHDRLDGTPFGERGLALLRLILPAFRAGVANQRALAGVRRGFEASLDALDLAVAIYSRAGERLHCSRALERLLAGDPEAAALRDALVATARASGCGAATAPPRGGARPGPGPGRVVQTTTESYRLSATRAGNLLPGHEDATIVRVEGASPGLPDAPELHERFGLTHAEIRVARLIARGETNARVADLLCISPHTAERHTESIFRKLDVHSRSAVAARLLGSAH